MSKIGSFTPNICLTSAQKLVDDINFKANTCIWSSQQLKIKQHIIIIIVKNTKDVMKKKKKERNYDIDMYACSIYNTNIPYRL